MAVGPDGAVRQHDSLAPSCRTTCVAEQGKIVGLLMEVVHIFRLEIGEGIHVNAIRMVRHGEIDNAKDACLEPFDVFLATDDEGGFRVVVDILNLFDVEL